MQSLQDLCMIKLISSNKTNYLIKLSEPLKELYQQKEMAMNCKIKVKDIVEKDNSNFKDDQLSGLNFVYSSLTLNSIYETKFSIYEDHKQNTYYLLESYFNSYIRYYLDS